MAEHGAKRCDRCSGEIGEMDLHKIVMYVINERLTEHHYEHVECPGRWTA